MQLAHPIFKILSEIAVEKGLEIYVIGSPPARRVMDSNCQN